MKFRSVPFVITPEELKSVLRPFTLFVDNALVPPGYTHTPTDVFTDSYTQIYKKLCAGEKIDHRADYRILTHLSLTTDITSVKFRGGHMYEGKEYMMYTGSDRGKAPFLAPFTFSVYTENSKICVSVRGSYLADYLDIMGFQLIFPELSAAEAKEYGISSEKQWESYSDYKLFRKNIIKITSDFCFAFNGTEKKTSVRVSDEARKALPRFHCVRSSGITVI